MANLDYTTIDRPYDSNLNREGDALVNQELTGNTGSGSMNGGVSTAVQTPTFLDIWIETWIKSRNYRPKTSGFYMDGRTGYAEFMSLYVKGGLSVTGSIAAGSLDIPDTTTSNSFHVDVDGNTWWGTTNDSFTADNNNALAYVLKTGVAKFQNIALSGNVSISGIINDTSTDISLLSFTHDIVFSASATNIVAWTAGTITMSSGRTFSISSGNTGVMTLKTILWLKTLIDAENLKNTTMKH